MVLRPHLAHGSTAVPHRTVGREDLLFVQPIRNTVEDGGRAVRRHSARLERKRSGWRHVIDNLQVVAFGVNHRLVVKERSERDSAGRKLSHDLVRHAKDEIRCRDAVAPPLYGVHRQKDRLQSHKVLDSPPVPEATACAPLSLLTPRIVL